jgi:NADPH:quinone reductase-like Zn-dependent oxidoreductase
MAIRSPHHDDVAFDVVESDRAVSPHAFNCCPAFDRQAEFCEEHDRRIQIVDDDGDIVHPLNSHQTTSSPRSRSKPNLLPASAANKALCARGRIDSNRLSAQTRLQMKAVVYDHYGPPDVLHIEDVAKPEPASDELLVRVQAAAVNRLDIHTREANASNGLGFSLVSRLVFGLRRPRHRIVGSEYSGEVERVGDAVREFKAGDQVFGVTGLRFGANAEYVTVREQSRVGLKPSNASFEEAAGLADGFLNAAGCLQHADLRPGSGVLVYGASGSIGIAGVQLARCRGADVTAVCQAKDFDLVWSLGANELVDYTKEDFTKKGKTYDVIFDAAGKLSYWKCKASLNTGGWYLPTDGAANLFLIPLTKLVGDKKVGAAVGSTSPKKDLAFLKLLVEAGLYRPIIDRVYGMNQVIEATRYVESQQKVGNVVLTIP